MPEWFDTFFGGLYAHVLNRHFDDPASQEQARVVRRVLQLRSARRVLDIPCGLGRLTIPLAQAGLHMTGVDLTPTYLRRARRRARQAGVHVRFVRSDMRDIAFNAQFDAALNWFGSFGYFSDEDNLGFCQRVFRALKPGGRFLVEGMNKSWLLTHFRPTSDHTTGGVRIVTRVRWDPGTNRVHGRWTLHRSGRTERLRISMRMFNGTEIRAVLRAAGFRNIRLFGYPPLGPFTRHSRRFLAVGQRPR